MSRKVTVLLCVYNSGPKVLKTVASVLAQTYGDFDFIIVDDGSAVDTSDLLRKCSSTDSRIHLINNAGNLGLTASLNIGLRAAKSQLIARIDAGDLWLPDKLRLQVAKWEATPGLAVLGTQADIVGLDGGFLRKTRLPTDDTGIRGYMFSGANPFIHSSVLFSNGVQYDMAYPHVEDIALWRSLFCVGTFLNLPESLVVYEADPVSVSYRKKAYQVYYGYDSFQDFVLKNTGINGERFLCGASLSESWAKLYGKLYSAAVRAPVTARKILVWLVYLTYPRVLITRLLFIRLAKLAHRQWGAK